MAIRYTTRTSALDITVLSDGNNAWGERLSGQLCLQAFTGQGPLGRRALCLH